MKNTSNDLQELIKVLDYGLKATTIHAYKDDEDDSYMAGLRNGLRYAIALLTLEQPDYEQIPMKKED